MSKMVLSSTLATVTFLLNPSTMTMPEKDVDVAVKPTYSSVAYFSWASTYVGKIIDLGWGYMPSAQFESISELYRAGGEVVFDPQDGKSLTFDAFILDFKGEYHILLGSTNTWRKNVKLQLLLLGLS